MCGHITAAYLSHYAWHGGQPRPCESRWLKRIACDIICEDRALSSSATSLGRGRITHKEVRFQRNDKETKKLHALILCGIKALLTLQNR